MRHPWSIARRIAAVHMLLVGVIALFSGWAAYLQARDVALAVEERHVAGVTALVAQEDEVVRALGSPAGAAQLQGRIPHWIDSSRASWLTVLDPTGLRVASWHAEQVGTRYPEPVDRAAAGQSWTEVSSTGPAGRSVRALAPVRDPADGRVIGVLTMGVQVSELDILAGAQLPRIALSFGLIALAGLFASWLVGRYLDHVTLGRGPEELAEQFLLAETAMDALDVGILVLSPAGRVRLANSAARRLLDLPADDTPGLPAPLARALAEASSDEVRVPLGGRLIVVQRRGVARPGATRAGTRALERAAAVGGVRPAPQGSHVLMLVDRTDLQRLGDELSVARTLTAALRAQTHEHANQLHTVLSLVEAGRLDAAKDVLARHDRHGEGGDDVLTALLSAKAAQARERGVVLHHRLDLLEPPPLSALDLLGVLGNLVDNALDAAAAPGRRAADRWVEVEVASDAAGLVVQVADGGAGPAPESRAALFAQGWSTKPAGAAGRGMGLWLVERIAREAGGRVDLATDSGTVFTVEVPPRAKEDSHG